MSTVNSNQIYAKINDLNKLLLNPKLTKVRRSVKGREVQLKRSGWSQPRSESQRRNAFPIESTGQSSSVISPNCVLRHQIPCAKFLGQPSYITARMQEKVIVTVTCIVCKPLFKALLLLLSNSTLSYPQDLLTLSNALVNPLLDPQNAHVQSGLLLPFCIQRKPNLNLWGQ